jgi:hypothetical protein
LQPKTKILNLAKGYLELSPTLKAAWANTPAAFFKTKNELKNHESIS